MMRFKTVFGRLMATYLLIALITVLLLGVMTTQILRDYSINEAKENLSDLTGTVTQLFQENVKTGDIGEGLHADIKQLSVFDQADIWVVDHFGSVRTKFMGSDALTDKQDQLLSHKDQMFSACIAGKTEYLVYYENNLLATPVISIGAPLLLDGKINGVVFAHVKLVSLERSLKIFYQQLIISTCVSMVIAFGFIFFTARRIERPLGEINGAAKEFAKGNFKKRLQIDDQSEVGQLAETFNSMAEALEKYENTRTSFVANVSHELKSPLTSIQGFVQGIQDGTIRPEEQKQYLDIVLSETKRMNTLIVELLDLAKIESGQFPLHKTDWDLNELLRRCLLNFVTKIEEKNLEVAVNIPEGKAVVTADQDRMMQVVSNLLDNAVKFAEPGGMIKIWAYEAEGKAHVSIANSGEIIPEEDLPFVFDRFFKVDRSHNRKVKGTGIGLSIVKNILLQHDQNIWVNSKQGEGTVFTFTLPLKKG